MIENYQEEMSIFNKALSQYYQLFSSICTQTAKLGNIVEKCGQPLRNHEWEHKEVVDLSTMSQSNVCIINASDGSLFSTNVKTLEPTALLYGSIRPYFRKAGFAVNADFVTGTVHEFKTSKECYLWVLGVISSEKFHDFTNTNSQGTKMPMINFSTMCLYDMPLPSREVLRSYNEIVSPIYLHIRQIMKKLPLLQREKTILLEKYF